MSAVARGPVDEAAEGPAAAVAAWVGEAGPEALGRTVQDGVRATGATYGVAADAHVYAVECVPRVIQAEEWERVAAGVAQRVGALEALLADLDGPREAVRAGVVPEDAVAGSIHLEAAERAGVPRPRVRIGVAGPDLVRDADGRFVVLEDNVRTPTMLGFALTIRAVVGAHVQVPGVAPRAVEEPTRLALERMLAGAASPELDAPPVCAILGDGPGGAGALGFELDVLARLLGVPLVGIEDLARAGDDVVLPDGRRVDVLWRRTSEERLGTGGSGPSPLGALLQEPLRAGRVRVVNAFGVGVADDKRVLPHVEDVVRFFCGEEPLLRAPRTWALTDADGLREAEARVGEVVLKPRWGSGGHGVLVGPAASTPEREATLAAVRRSPGDWIAQEVVSFSTHPTVTADGGLAPRHVDLRPYAVNDGTRIEVLPTAYTRVALGEGDLVVNSSQGGGGKDTWVL